MDLLFKSINRKLFFATFNIIMYSVLEFFIVFTSCMYCILFVLCIYCSCADPVIGSCSCWLSTLNKKLNWIIIIKIEVRCKSFIHFLIRNTFIINWIRHVQDCIWTFLVHKRWNLLQEKRETNLLAEVGQGWKLQAMQLSFVLLRWKEWVCKVQAHPPRFNFNVRSTQILCTAALPWSCWNCFYCA
jgi:hypothetical protein